MKKFMLGIALVGMVSLASASTLNEAQKKQVLNKIAQLEQVNGYDVQDNIKLVNKGTDAQVKAYLVELNYNAAKKVDSPNSLDLADLKAGLEKKTIAELSK